MKIYLKQHSWLTNGKCRLIQIEINPDSSSKRLNYVRAEQTDFLYANLKDLI